MYIVRILTLVVLLYQSVSLAETNEPFNYYHPASGFLEEIEKNHLQKGIDKVKKGQFEFAWNEFAFLLHYFPNHPHALQIISDLSLQMEDKARAIKYFDRATKLYPQEAPTYALYGIFLTKIGQPQKAITLYQKAIEIDGKPAEYYYHLGLAYLAMHDYKNANLSAQKAYRLDYPLPGLKDKLLAEGAWKSDANENIG